MEKKLFIIEDDVNILSALKAKFSVENFRVESDSGSTVIEEIVKKINAIHPDFIILDLILPRVSGFDILSSIKSDKEISGIPVLVFTNLSDADSKERSNQLGSDYYFIKSDFTIDEFIEKIKKIIANKEK